MAKSLSLNEIHRRSAQFVVDWREEPGDERQQAQSFIRDLLQVFGITSTKAALYEKRAQRSSTGNQGYIDALVPGLCAIEMKSVGKDLGSCRATGTGLHRLPPHVETPPLDYRLRLPAVPHPRTRSRQPHRHALLLPGGTPGEHRGPRVPRGLPGPLFGDPRRREQMLFGSRADHGDPSSRRCRDSGATTTTQASASSSGSCSACTPMTPGYGADPFYEFLERRTSEDGLTLAPSWRCCSRQ